MPKPTPITSLRRSFTSLVRWIIHAFLRRHFLTTSFHILRLISLLQPASTIPRSNPSNKSHNTLVWTQTNIRKQEWHGCVKWLLGNKFASLMLIITTWANDITFTLLGTWNIMTNYVNGWYFDFLVENTLTIFAQNCSKPHVRIKRRRSSRRAWRKNVYRDFVR